MFGYGLPLTAAEDGIRSRRFVSLVAAGADFRVHEADAGEQVVGITRENSRRWNDVSHADTGEPVAVYTHSQTCRLVAGAAVTVGERLKSDAEGRGIPLVGGAGTTEEYGAVALEAASAANEVIQVRVEIGILVTET